MTTLLISFVGGRPLPNIQLILDVKPDELYLIVSQDSTGKSSNQEKLITALPANLKPIDSYPVAPYVPGETMNACQKIIDKHTTDTIILNIASEPTTMSLGAYQFAKKMKQEGKSIALLYSSRDGIVDIFNETQSPRPLKISIYDYFTVYGWHIETKTDIEKNNITVTKLLVENLPVSHDVLKMMRQYDKGNANTIHLKQHCTDEQYHLLQEIEKIGFLKNVQKTVSGVSYTKTSQDDWEFLKGGWLEFYVYMTAKALQHPSGQPLFDECAWGVEEKSEGIRDGKGEIDFVGIFKGQLIIASCKTESKIKAEYFNQLSTRGDQLGKGMCTKLFVTSTFPTENQRKDAERWAQERGIMLVCGNDLSTLGHILEQAVNDCQRI